jgi:hypothetical protein
MPTWAFPVLVVGGLFNLACAIALLRWKKWGFWGFTGSAAVILVVNLVIGTNPVSSFGGIVGIGVLYGVLHIGQENKGWTQLE